MGSVKLHEWEGPRGAAARSSEPIPQLGMLPAHRQPPPGVAGDTQSALSEALSAAPTSALPLCSSPAERASPPQGLGTVWPLLQGASEEAAQNTNQVKPPRPPAFQLDQPTLFQIHIWGPLSPAPHRHPTLKTSKAGGL